MPEKEEKKEALIIEEMNFVSLFSQLATIRISEKSSHKFKIINKCQCPLPQLKHIQCSAADMFSSILQT